MRQFKSSCQYQILPGKPWGKGRNSAFAVFSASSPKYLQTLPPIFYFLLSEWSLVRKSNRMSNTSLNSYIEYYGW